MYANAKRKIFDDISIFYELSRNLYNVEMEEGKCII